MFSDGQIFYLHIFNALQDRLFATLIQHHSCILRHKKTAPCKLNRMLNAQGAAKYFRRPISANSFIAAHYNMHMLYPYLQIYADALFPTP